MKTQKVWLLALCATAAWGQSAQKGSLVDRGTAVYSTGAVGSLAFGDNRYCAKGDVPAFGAAFDGPAQLPVACIYTGTDGTPSGTHLDGSLATTWPVRSDSDTTRCSVGAPDNGQCAVNDWNTAMAGLACGDTVLIEHGAVLPAPSSTGFVLPHLACDANHWITVESDSVVSDVNFPAEGTRATPCHIGLASVANYPSYSCASASQRMATFVTTGTTASALTLDNQITPTCTAFPCTDHWRFIGLEFTNQPPNAGGTPSTRTSHKLVDFTGGDHMILDRSIVHGQNDPLFQSTSEVQGGVQINGSYMAVIDSWVYDIFCANASTGLTCIDSTGVFGGTGQYPQIAHKIVNNLVAAAGESWFWGGASTAYYPTASNPDGGPSDIEVRRNHSFKPLSWFLPNPVGPFALTSVDNAGNYTGTVPDGVNNGLVGKTIRISGFTNAANNLAAPGLKVTGSTSTTISFGNATVAETAAATATNPEPHWDTKNLGESKGSNRSLWEGNVAENSWQGFQSDQRGNAFLSTPKSQDKQLAIPSGDVFTGSSSGGNFYINCTNGGVSCSSVGKGAFTCDLDPSALPDWTGNGTTLSSCGAIVAFACAAGTQAGCPGSYAKICGSKGDINHCAVIIAGVLSTGTYYHVLSVISADQVQVAEDPTSVSNATALIATRGLNQFAAVRNLTLRYNLARHLADFMENASAQGDSGTNARGVHNVSIHDNAGYDIDPAFWSNLNSCCDSGWAIKLLSGTSDPTVVPSNITFAHNTFLMIGFSGSAASGLVDMFDTRCSPPVSAGTCSGGVTPAYFGGLTIQDNISAASFHTTGNGSNFTPLTVANGLGIYGCSGNDGVTGCDYQVRKNLLLTGLWSGQIDETPNLNLLGANTVEACSCTTAANGGNCTPGTPNAWSSPVTTGSIDACDRATSAGLYSDLFANWNANGTSAMDLHLKTGSPYLGQASDGGNLGANEDLINTMTTGAASAVSFSTLTITTSSLPNGTNGAQYSQQVVATAGASPYKVWTISAGALPGGLGLTAGDGTISGTPRATGTFSFTVQVEDAGHQFATKALSIQVN